MTAIRFLVIDDERNVRDIIRFGLQQTFPCVVVDEALNGRQAKEDIEKKNYDLIMCDWNIPHIQGDELLLWLRGHPTLSGTPFIMLSATNEKPYIIRALELGANAYVTKPFTIAGLIQKVTALVDKLKIRAFERHTAVCPVILRFPNGEMSGNLIDISSGGLFGAFQRGQSHPQILERVIADIETEDGQRISGLKGLTVRLQAETAAEDSKHINIAVKFIEMSSVNKEALMRYFV